MSGIENPSPRCFLSFQNRSDVVECMMTLQNFAKKFLPNALREFFSRMEAPNDRGRQVLINVLYFCPGLGEKLSEILPYLKSCSVYHYVHVCMSLHPVSVSFNTFSKYLPQPCFCPCKKIAPYTFYTFILIITCKLHVILFSDTSTNCWTHFRSGSASATLTLATQSVSCNT